MKFRTCVFKFINSVLPDPAPKKMCALDVWTPVKGMNNLPCVMNRLAFLDYS